MTKRTAYVQVRAIEKIAIDDNKGRREQGRISKKIKRKIIKNGIIILQFIEELVVIEIYGRIIK